MYRNINLNFYGLQQLQFWKKEHCTLQSLALRNFLLQYITGLCRSVLNGHMNAPNQTHRIWKCNILYCKKILWHVMVLHYDFVYVNKHRWYLTQGGTAVCRLDWGRANNYSPLKTSMLDKYYTWPWIFWSGYVLWNDLTVKVCRMLRRFLCTAGNWWLTLLNAFDDMRFDTNLY